MIKALFTIDLIEDEDGNVLVRSNYTGEGEAVEEIGHDILRQLLLAESISNGNITVQALHYLAHIQ